MPISGRLRAASRNLFRLFTRNSDSRPERSSSTNWNPPEVPDSLNRRRGEGEDGSLRKRDQLQVQLRLDYLVLLLDCLAVFPRLQGHPEEGVVGAAGQAEKTESDSGGAVFDPRVWTSAHLPRPGLLPPCSEWKRLRAVAFECTCIPGPRRAGSSIGRAFMQKRLATAKPASATTAKVALPNQMPGSPQVEIRAARQMCD